MPRRPGTAGSSAPPRLPKRKRLKQQQQPPPPAGQGHEGAVDDAFAFTGAEGTGGGGGKGQGGGRRISVHADLVRAGVRVLVGRILASP